MNIADRKYKHNILFIGAPEEGVILKNKLNSLGHNILIVTSYTAAMNIIGQYKLDIIFIDMDVITDDVVRLVEQISNIKAKSTIINMVVVENPESEKLARCIKAGAEDFLLKPLMTELLQARIAVIHKQLSMQKYVNESIKEQEVARGIFDTAIEYRNIDVKGMQSFNQPANIFSGDLILSSKSPEGDICVLLADFTGHGISAAIAVLPMLHVFANRVKRGDRVESIIRNINDKLIFMLPVSMFMACCVVKIDVLNREISIWNAAMPDIIIVDKNRKIIRQIASGSIPLGVDELSDKQIQFEFIDLDMADSVIMMSDGMTDAVDGSGKMFGIGRLQKSIQACEGGLHETIIDSYMEHCQNLEPVDDVSLVTLSIGEMFEASEKISYGCGVA